jgi:hypothetical protein
MTPTHCNKRGVRYRYYTSHAHLQGRGDEAGTVSRVSGPDIECIVLEGLRAYLAATREDFGPGAVRKAPGANGRSESRHGPTGDRDRGRRDLPHESDDSRSWTVGDRPPTEDGRNQANDRQLIEDHVEKIVVTPEMIDVVLRSALGGGKGRVPTSQCRERQAPSAKERKPRANTETKKKTKTETSDIRIVRQKRP